MKGMSITVDGPVRNPGIRRQVGRDNIQEGGHATAVTEEFLGARLFRFQLLPNAFQFLASFDVLLDGGHLSLGLGHIPRDAAPEGKRHQQRGEQYTGTSLERPTEQSRLADSGYANAIGQRRKCGQVIRAEQPSVFGHTPRYFSDIRIEVFNLDGTLEKTLLDIFSDIGSITGDTLPDNLACPKEFALFKIPRLGNAIANIPEKFLTRQILRAQHFRFYDKRGQVRENSETGLHYLVGQILERPAQSDNSIVAIDGGHALEVFTLELLVSDLDHFYRRCIVYKQYAICGTAICSLESATHFEGTRAGQVHIAMPGATPTKHPHNMGHATVGTIANNQHPPVPARRNAQGCAKCIGHYFLSPAVFSSGFSSDFSSAFSSVFSGTSGFWARAISSAISTLPSAP